MSVNVMEIAGALIYLLGYMIATVIAFFRKEPVCWAYSTITLAATIHVFRALAQPRRNENQNSSELP